MGYYTTKAFSAVSLSQNADLNALAQVCPSQNSSVELHYELTYSWNSLQGQKNVDQTFIVSDSCPGSFNRIINIKQGPLFK